MIRLISVYHSHGVRPHATRFLYDLMKEREPEINISHSALPTWKEHVDFLRRRPFRLWYLIEADGVWVGYISATHNNEIGIVLKRAYRGMGYGPDAIRALRAQHRPLTVIPSKRAGQWLANIAPANTHSQHIFEGLGFREIQRTYAYYPEEENNGEKSSEVENSEAVPEASA